MNDIDKKKQELLQEQLSNIQIKLAPADISVDLSKASKIPYGEMAMFGAAFASMSEAFRTVTQSTVFPNSAGTLMQAFDGAGNLLNISQLQKFNTPGAGSLGSMIDSAKGFSQAHFFAAGPQEAVSTVVMPINPLLIATAIAVHQVNEKIDGIQATVDEMFEYLRMRDKANMRGDLQTLATTINEYSLNCDNSIYIHSAHMKVMDIRHNITQDMEFFRAQAVGKFQKKGRLEARAAVNRRLEAGLDYLKDYQLALYIFAFASFLEPLLSGNLNPDKLQAVIDSIREEALRYRELYTECANAIEDATNDSVDARVLGGLASSAKKLGKAVAATRVGDHTLIDEGLEGAGRLLAQVNDGVSDGMINKMLCAKVPDLNPFIESVQAIDAIYNKPTRILMDRENLYVLPMAA